MGLPLIGQLGLDVDSAQITVDNIDQALADASDELINEPLVSENGLVSIDLATGDITVDLEQLVEGGLNGQDPNTEVLSGAMATDIVLGVNDALGTLTEKVGNLVTPILENAGVTITLDLSGSVLGEVNADVSATIQSTLGELAGTVEGDPTIEITGTVEALGVVDVSLDDLLGPLTTALQGLLDTTVQPVIATLLTNLTTGFEEALNEVITPLVSPENPLELVLRGLTEQLVSVTVNEQPTPGLLGEESFTVNALSLTLLPTISAIDVDLASSTVRSSAAVAEEPSIAVDPGTVEDGGVTTVTGENYPPNTDVDVQLTDLDGNPIGDAVTVTTDDAGAFTTDLTVPEGTEAGDYLVEGTATTGETATAPLAVTNADDPTDDNTADNTEVNTSVNTADNTSVNTADNTGENTSVNTSDNTSVNTSVNTADNTSVNTSDNTSVNTADNTGDNTSVNAADNTADNTDVNTAENDADNTEVNTADNTDVNTAENDADNTEVNTADNTDVNTAENDADNTEVNTADNTDVNTAENDADNTAENTADNTADNTGDNTADNTATAELDVTPKRAVQGVDTVLVHGSGYAPNGTADIFLRPMDGDVINEEEAAEVEPMVELANQGFTTLALANPGENIGTVDVDADGELVFRIATDDIELGDYVVTAIDQTDPELEAYELFTLVAADAPAEDPAISVDPSTVNDGESTTVTGENFPPNTEVEVQLTDPEGSPVGDPVTVTTDDNGGFTTEVTVPEGTPAADYFVVATPEGGDSVTDILTVTNESGSDNGADNTADNTGENTTDNTGDNTGENGADNTGENTADNTGENTGDNTGDDGTTEDPTVSVDPETVDDGESTTVTGENFPPNTEVEVQLTDPEGNPVGDPVTVTTDENGGFTAEITVPEGSDAGDYEIVAEAETGESASETLTVTNGSGADNGAANGGDNTADNGGDNTADDAGDNGADNTSANTGGNGTSGGSTGNGSGGSYGGGTSGNGGGGSLAQTGAAGTAAMAGLAALLLLAGSAALITRRRAGR